MITYSCWGQCQQKESQATIFVKYLALYAHTASKSTCTRHPKTSAYIRVCVCISCGYPAGTRRNNNVFTTSTRRRRRRVDVVKTLSLRHYCVMCPLGSHGSCVSHIVALALYSVRYVEENDNDYGWILYGKISTFERTICFPYQVNCVLIFPHPGLGTHSPPDSDATSHYLDQWWLVYGRIYESAGLN